jgi:uncharacterized protein (DUF433 family)
MIKINTDDYGGKPLICGNVILIEDLQQREDIDYLNKTRVQILKSYPLRNYF